MKETVKLHNINTTLNMLSSEIDKERYKGNNFFFVSINNDIDNHAVIAQFAKKDMQEEANYSYIPEVKKSVDNIIEQIKLTKFVSDNPTYFTTLKTGSSVLLNVARVYDAYKVIQIGFPEVIEFVKTGIKKTGGKIEEYAKNHNIDDSDLWTIFNAVLDEYNASNGDWKKTIWAGLKSTTQVFLNKFKKEKNDSQKDAAEKDTGGNKKNKPTKNSKFKEATD